MVGHCSAFRVGPRSQAGPPFDGPLCGVRLAVKDVIDVAGERTGAGNPAWLAEARPAARSARAVEALVGAGAQVVGKTRTDELAFSLDGSNPHEGAPFNPAAPGHLTGGSSSGSASAVALGWADVGLGTDTGGSIRVPASYTGLVGFRPSHGAVPVDGVLPLAPRFDTVGWLTRSGRLAARVASALLPEGPAGVVEELVMPLDLLGSLDPPLAGATTAGALRLARREGLDVVGGEVLAGTTLETCRSVFQAIQWAEIWSNWGPWVSSHWEDLGAPTRARLEAVAAASLEGPARTDAAEAARSELVATLRAQLGRHRALVLPSAASAAPRRDASATTLVRVRQATLALTSVAGLLGGPAVSLPVTRLGGLPLGISLIGLPGADQSLLAVAASVVP